MIGVIGLQREKFNDFYRSNPDYFYIMPDMGNCIGRSFDAILSYVPIHVLDKEILFNLQTRLNKPPFIIHEVTDAVRFIKGG